MERCKKCILPVNYPGVTFDENGVCNFCNQYERPHFLGLDELKRDIRSRAIPDQAYDCILGLSGGRDSTYLLYILSRKLGLKVLAFNYDHGYIPEQSRANARNAAKSLNVDYEVLSGDYLRKLLPFHLKTWLRRPSPAMIGLLCVGCRLGTDLGLLRIAKKYHVPVIAYGGHPLEGVGFKMRLLQGDFETGTGLSMIKGYLSEIGKNPRWLLNPYSLITQFREYAVHFSPMRKLFKGSWQASLLNFSPFFRYIRWEEKEVISTIQDELDWRKPEMSDSTWRSDCRIGMLKQYLYMKTLGFSDKDDGLSCLIRDGQITRDEALARLKIESKLPLDYLDSFLQQFDLSLEKVDRALSSKRNNVTG